jgi:hypothetical protein
VQISVSLLDQMQPDAEWEAMMPGDRHATVFWWIQSKLVQLERANVINSGQWQMLMSSVSNMRSTANDLMGNLVLDKPFPYTALCGLLIFINIFLNTTWKGVTWSTWLFSYGTDLFRQPRIWVDMLVLLTWNISYAALYDLGYMLNNPFGQRRIDVAHELISNNLRRLTSAFTSVVPNLPPFMKKSF